MKITDNSMVEDEPRLQPGAAHRIRWALAQRPAMHIGELCMRLGLREDAVRSALEGMSDNGEVEVLRPVDCRSADHDFFRLCEANTRREVYREIGRSAYSNKPDDYVLAGIVG